MACKVMKVFVLVVSRSMAVGRPDCTSAWIRPCESPVSSTTWMPVSAWNGWNRAFRKASCVGPPIPM